MGAQIFQKNLYFFKSNSCKKQKNLPSLQTNSTEWSNSSAGSEHLPYKQGVLGSNPSWTTIQNTKTPFTPNERCFFMPLILRNKKSPNPLKQGTLSPKKV